MKYTPDMRMFKIDHFKFFTADKKFCKHTTMYILNFTDKRFPRNRQYLTLLASTLGVSSIVNTHYATGFMYLTEDKKHVDVVFDLAYDVNRVVYGILLIPTNQICRYSNSKDDDFTMSIASITCSKKNEYIPNFQTPYSNEDVEANIYYTLKGIIHKLTLNYEILH